MPLRALPGLTPQQRYDAFEDDSQLMRGFKTGAAGARSGSFANTALQEELAANALRNSGAPETEIAVADEKWKATRDMSTQMQQDAQVYAPRVRSLKDVYNSANPISDGLDFAAGAFGSGVASMAPTLVAGLGTGLLTRSPKLAYAAAAAAGYQMEKGEAVSRQYNDPVLAATSAEERDKAGVGKAIINAGFEAAVPAALAGSLFRRAGKGLAATVGTAAVAESGTEGIQSVVGFGAEKYLDPNRKLDPWEVADSVASGFLTGGGVRAATGIPGAVLNRVAPVDPNVPPAPPADPTKLSRTDKFLDALSTTSNPITAIRSAFGSREDDAAADLLSDDQDPDVLNAADPEAAMNQRTAERTARAAQIASDLMNDTNTLASVKENIAKGDQDTLNNIVVAHDKATRLANTVMDFAASIGEKVKNISGKNKGPGGTTSSNLQNFGDESVAPLVGLLSQHLGPRAVEAPTLARQLLAAAAMFDGTKPLTPDTAARLEGLSGAVGKDVLDMVSSITGSDGLQSTIARIQAIPSATNDVGRNSFMESVIKVPMSDRDKRYLAAAVDDAGLKVKPDNKLITALASFFGDEATAQTVVDYYGKRRRAAFQKEAEANKLPEDRPNPQDDIKYQADTTQTTAPELSDEQTEKAAEFGALTENGEPPNTYKFRDAKQLRPYRAFAKRASTEGGMNKRSKESTLAMLELRRNSPDSARVRPVKYSRYVDDMGLDQEQELRRILGDTVELRVAEEAKNKDQKKNGDRTAKIEELQGQEALINEIYLQGGPQAALDLFEVLQVSQTDKNDQVADDDTVAKYAGLLGKTRDPKSANKDKGETYEGIEAENKAIRDTTITFIKTNGSKIALSAESMWKSQGDKNEKVGSSKGEPSKKRILRLFNDAVNAMLARPDIKGIVKTKFSSRAPFRSEGRTDPETEGAKVLTGKMREGLLIDRESGTRTPVAKTEAQKLAGKMQRMANAKENARRDMLDDREKRLAGAAVEAEASTRRTPETRTDGSKQKFLEEQKQADAKEEATAKKRHANLSGGPKARKAELQKQLDEFEAVLTAEKSNSNQIDVAEQLDEIMQPLRDVAVLAGQRASDAKAALKLARQNDAPKSEQYKLQTDFELEREALQDIRDTLEDMEGLQFEDSRDRNEDDRKGTTTEEKLGPVGYKGMPRTIMNEQDSDNGETRFFEDDTGAGIAKERGTRTGGAKSIAGKPYTAPANAEQPSARQRGDKVALPAEPLPSTVDKSGISPSDMAGNKTAEGVGKTGTLEKLIASGDAVVDTRKTMVDGKESSEDTVLVYNAKNTKLLAGTMPNGARYVNTGKLRDEGMLPYIKNSPMLMRVMDAMGITPEQLDAQLGNRARRLSFLRARESNRTKEKSLWSETRATFLALIPSEITALGVSPVGPKPEAAIDKTSSADINVQGGLNKANTGRIPTKSRADLVGEAERGAAKRAGTTKHSLMSTTSDSVYSTPFMTVLHQAGFKIGNSAMGDVVAKLLANPAIAPQQFAKEAAEGLSHMLLSGAYKKAIYDAIKTHGGATLAARTRRQYVLRAEGKSEEVAQQMAIREVLEKTLLQEVPTHKAPEGLLQVLMNLVSKLLDKLNGVTNSEAFGKAVLAQFNAFSRDIGTLRKQPGGLELVSFQTAVDRDRAAASVIAYMGKSPATTLVGSIVLATYGTIYRAPDNLLRDLDFIIDMPAEKAKNFLLRGFPNAVQVYSFSIRGMQDANSFIVPPPGATIANITREQGAKGKLTGYTVMKNGVQIGKMWAVGDKEMKTGSTGALVDLFTPIKGHEQNQTLPERVVSFTMGSQTFKVQVASAASIFDIKLAMGREKDLNDFIHFIAKKPTSEPVARTSKPIVGGTTKHSLQGPGKQWEDMDDARKKIVNALNAMTSAKQLKEWIAFHKKRMDAISEENAPRSAKLLPAMKEELEYAESLLAAMPPEPTQAAPAPASATPAGPQNRTSPPQGKPRRKPVSAKDQAKTMAIILRICGARIKAEFVSMLESGGVGSHTISDDKLERLIKISLYAGNPMSVGRHEAFHDFFAFLPETAAGRSIKKDLMDAANSPRIKAAIHKLLDKHPAAQKQAATDMEERLAYMFQFYMETDADGQRMLTLGPSAAGIFARIAQLFRDVFKIIGKEERARDLLTALNDGKFSGISIQPDVVNEVLADMPVDRFVNKLDRMAPVINDTLRAVFRAAPDRLRVFQNDKINKLAELFSSESGKLGFIQNRFQQDGAWTNRLGKILVGTTAVERRTALDNRQAMKPISSKLEQDIADLLENIHAYMIKAKVKTRVVVDPNAKVIKYKWIPLRHVQDFFPRDFDPAAILADVPGFTALLMKHGAFTPQEAETTIKNLTQGTGQEDPIETVNSLGLTPFAASSNARKLTFIRQKNAAEFAKYQTKDITDTLTGYIKQAVHRAEYARVFDNDGAKIRDLVEESGIKDPKDRASIMRIVQGLEGSLGSGMSTSTKELMSSVLTLQNVVLLPLSIFSQMMDPVVLAARSGSLRDAGDAYVLALKRLVGTKVDGGELADLLGITAQDSVLETMGMAHGGTQMSGNMRWINRMFFKYNGLQGWNNSMRIAATVAGEKFLIAHRNDVTALEELGLTPKDIVTKPKFAMVTKNGAAAYEHVGESIDTTSPAVKQAMFRFVDQAVIRPSASNRPVWMSDPRFLLVAHLKQFTFAMQNVVLKRATAQLADGNVRPWATLLLAMPVMFASDMGKTILRGDAHMAGWGFFDYLKNTVERSGLLGIGDFGNQAMEDGGRGKLPGESLLGPAADHLLTILRWIGGDARTDFGDVVDRTVPGAKFL